MVTVRKYNLVNQQCNNNTTASLTDIEYYYYTNEVQIYTL